MNADFFTAISAINDEDDYVKAGNYWRWLKRKLSGDEVQLVSALTTSSLRLRTVDRKTAKLSGKRLQARTVARPGRCLTS